MGIHHCSPSKTGMKPSVISLGCKWDITTLFTWYPMIFGCVPTLGMPQNCYEQILTIWKMIIKNCLSNFQSHLNKIPDEAPQSWWNKHIEAWGRGANLRPQGMATWPRGWCFFKMGHMAQNPLISLKIAISGWFWGHGPPFSGELSFCHDLLPLFAGWVATTVDGEPSEGETNHAQTHLTNLGVHFDMAFALVGFSETEGPKGYHISN
jgi:hypothetical protein